MLHDLEQLWPQLRQTETVAELRLLLPQFGFTNSMQDRFPYQNKTTDDRNTLIPKICPLLPPLVVIVMEYAHDEIYDVSDEKKAQNFTNSLSNHYQSNFDGVWYVIDQCILSQSIPFPDRIHIIKLFLELYHVAGLLYLLQRITRIATNTFVLNFWMHQICSYFCRWDLHPCEYRQQSDGPCICVVD